MDPYSVYYSVQEDYSYIQTFDIKSLKHNSLFYVKGVVNQEWSYGCLGDYYIIDYNGEPSCIQFGNYSLYEFHTKGIAKNYKLELKVRDNAGKDSTYTLSTDAHYNPYELEKCGYEEWSYNIIFKSIADFFEALNRYGYDVYETIRDLQIECHNTKEDLRFSKYSHQKETESLKQQISELRNSLIDVVINENSISILPKLYSKSQSIKRVIIHRNIKVIYAGAFQGCSNLSEIFCMATTPPILNSATVFDGIAKNAKIYVPKIAIDKYRSADYWKLYANIITEYDY